MTATAGADLQMFLWNCRSLAETDIVFCDSPSTRANKTCIIWVVLVMVVLGSLVLRKRNPVQNPPSASHFWFGWTMMGVDHFGAFHLRGLASAFHLCSTLKAIIKRNEPCTSNYPWKDVFPILYIETNGLQPWITIAGLA